jgi:hypothetical protein
MKQNRFFIVYDQAPRFREEVYSYVWNEKTGVPNKQMDDVQDSIRYGIYSDLQMQKQKKKANVGNRLAAIRRLGLGR